MNDEMNKLLTRDGFIEVFWETIQAEPDTHQNIFHRLCEESSEAFGVCCFPSYDAFRKYRDRRH